MHEIWIIYWLHYSTLLLSDKQKQKKNLPHQCWFQLQKRWNMKNKNVHKIMFLTCDDTSLGELQVFLHGTLKISKQNL